QVVIVFASSSHLELVIFASFCFTAPATTHIYTLSLHDALPILPVWPSGADELHPLYQSPSSGSPSQMMQNITGGEDGIRFSDSCSGAVAISSDGLTVTALSVTPECRLHASVGNFTNLESTPFSITTRDNAPQES